MTEIVATLPPLHPGELLREEFLEPLGLTPYQIAKAIGVPRTRVERVTREEIGITADTALRLARYFGTSAEFWIGLHTQFEMRSAERSLGDEIARIEPLARSAA